MKPKGKREEKGIQDKGNSNGKGKEKKLGRKVRELIKKGKRTWRKRTRGKVRRLIKKGKRTWRKRTRGKVRELIKRGKIRGLMEMGNCEKEKRGSN